MTAAIALFYIAVNYPKVFSFWVVHKGEMCRVPELAGNNSSNKVQWSFSGKLHDIENPSVLSGSWNIPSEDRQIFMFLNYSYQPVNLKFACGLDKKLANGAELVLFWPDGSIEAMDKISEVYTFAPCCSFIIEVKANGNLTSQN